jgi:hypothetical protein
MAILTYRQLGALEAKRAARRSSESLHKSASLENSLKKRIFLSHSHHDRDSIPGVIEFFADWDAGVDVDTGETQLPNPPSPETAKILRVRIKAAPHFVVLLSPKSYESGWIPWELGLADGLKGNGPVALLPSSESPSDNFWQKREYLGLYPRIIFGTLNGYEDSVWQVFDPTDNKSWDLGSWLRRDFQSQQ